MLIRLRALHAQHGGHAWHAHIERPDRTRICDAVQTDGLAGELIEHHDVTATNTGNDPDRPTILFEV